MTPKPLDEVIGNVNTALRGWVGYFHYQHCTQSFAHVKRHVEQRMAIHLRKRYKIRDKGAGDKRFTSRVLYERFGLYKAPTTAGWTKAHA
jgi:hypothetical protein